MKKHSLYIASLLAIALTAVACEQDLMVYQDTDRLNFVQTSASDTIATYSFVFEPQAATELTVWIDVSTMGRLSDADRSLSISQAPSYGKNAVAGVHYAAFDNAAMKDRYVVQAGQNRTRIPVTLLRDASLQSGDVELRIVFTPNAFFSPGYGRNSHRTLVISDRLSKPENWNAQMNFYFGAYGPEKHKFMIESSGKRIDKDWVEEVRNAMNTDFDYVLYLSDWFQLRLDAENARRAALTPPLGPLAETDGTKVAF